METCVLSNTPELLLVMNRTDPVALVVICTEAAALAETTDPTTA
jgi:hypothetical protein